MANATSKATAKRAARASPSGRARDASSSVSAEHDEAMSLEAVLANLSNRALGDGSTGASTGSTLMPSKAWKPTNEEPALDSAVASSDSEDLAVSQAESTRDASEGRPASAIAVSSAARRTREHEGKPKQSTKEQQMQGKDNFHIIRQCSILDCSAMFFSWKDCAQVLSLSFQQQAHSGGSASSCMVEYRSFQTLPLATEYLFGHAALTESTAINTDPNKFHVLLKSAMFDSPVLLQSWKDCAHLLSLSFQQAQHGGSASSCQVEYRSFPDLKPAIQYSFQGTDLDVHLGMEHASLPGPADADDNDIGAGAGTTAQSAANADVPKIAESRKSTQDHIEDEDDDDDDGNHPLTMANDSEEDGSGETNDTNSNNYGINADSEMDTPPPPEQPIRSSKRTTERKKATSKLVIGDGSGGGNSRKHSARKKRASSPASKPTKSKSMITAFEQQDEFFLWLHEMDENLKKVESVYATHRHLKIDDILSLQDEITIDADQLKQLESVKVWLGEAHRVLIDFNNSEILQKTHPTLATLQDKLDAMGMVMIIEKRRRYKKRRIESDDSTEEAANQADDVLEEGRDGNEGSVHGNDNGIKEKKKKAATTATIEIQPKVIFMTKEEKRSHEIKSKLKGKSTRGAQRQEIHQIDAWSRSFNDNYALLMEYHTEQQQQRQPSNDNNNPSKRAQQASFHTTINSLLQKALQSPAQTAVAAQFVSPGAPTTPPAAVETAPTPAIAIQANGHQVTNDADQPSTAWNNGAASVPMVDAVHNVHAGNYATTTMTNSIAVTKATAEAIAALTVAASIPDTATTEHTSLLRANEKTVLLSVWADVTNDILRRYVDRKKRRRHREEKGKMPKADTILTADVFYEIAYTKEIEEKLDSLLDSGWFDSATTSTTETILLQGNTQEIEEGQQSSSPSKSSTARKPGRERKKRQSKAQPDEHWEERFADLVAYVNEHGNANVPVRSRQHSQLVHWIKRQKNSYEALTQGKHSFLTPQQQTRLEIIGLELKKKQMKSWMERAQQWHEYVTKTGKEPLRYSEDGLGKWVCEQRFKYRQSKQEGKKNNLTQERIDMLSSWGFNWKADTPLKKRNWETLRTWDERYEELRQYMEKNKNSTRVPQNYPGLGQWVHGQRSDMRRYMNGQRNSMSPYKIAKLKAIQFYFGTKRNPEMSMNPNSGGNSSDDEGRPDFVQHEAAASAVAANTGEQVPTMLAQQQDAQIPVPTHHHNAYTFQQPVMAGTNMNSDLSVHANQNQGFNNVWTQFIDGQQGRTVWRG